MRNIAAETTASKPNKVKIKKDTDLDARTFAVLGKIDQCPRNVNQVYSLGITLQEYIEASYLELAGMKQCPEKDLCTSLAEKQVESKQQVDVLRLANFNRLLTYFYDNGGPVIEDPVSDTQARMIMPFFTRIISNFEKHVNSVLLSAIKGKTPAKNLEACVNGILISTYSALSDLYEDKSIQNAFMELVNVTRQST